MKKIVFYLAKLCDGLAKGLFASIIIGLLIEQLFLTINLENIAYAGKIAQYGMGSAIGIAIAKVFKLKNISTITSAIVGLIGSGTISNATLIIGDPLTTTITCACVLPIINKLENNRTLDILTIPLLAIVLSQFFYSLAIPISDFVFYLGQHLNNAVNDVPIISSALVSLMIACAISGPISSAALSIVLGLNGQIAFAALCATSAQMSGFFIMSIKDNGLKNSLIILFGSSKLLLKNIIYNPLIFIPPLFASIITGVLGVLLTNLVSVKEAAGMGNLGFVGQVLTLETNGYSSKNILLLLMFCFIIPLMITYPLYVIMKKQNLIKDFDLKV